MTMKQTHYKSKSVHKLKRAFTLIEMMIVIGIIALLAALTLGISNNVMRGSEISQTDNTLKLLEMTLQEWELEMGRSMTFEDYSYPQPNNFRFDIRQSEINDIGEPAIGGAGVDDPEMLAAMESRIEAVTLAFLQSESATEILSKITSDHIIEDVHGKLIVDAWGTPMGIVFPGRAYADAYPAGANEPPRDQSGDLTIRDQAEDALGSCMNLRPYFVSAGPDKLWGYRFQANGGTTLGDPLWEASRDNIYSYEPYLVEEAR